MPEQGSNRSCVGIPQTYAPVYICAGEHVSLRAESNVQHRRFMVERGFLFSGVRVPQPHCTVNTCAGEEAARTTEVDAQDAPRMPAERGLKLSGAGVPQPHRAVGAAVASNPPSGLNAMLVTLSVWPRSVV